MQWLWVIYWPVIIGVPLILAILTIKNKRYLWGIIHLILSIFVPLFHMYLLDISQWDGNKENEFTYLFRTCFAGNMGSILIVLGYLTLLLLCFVNYIKVYKYKY